MIPKKRPLTGKTRNRNRHVAGLLAQGNTRKMLTELAEPVQYRMILGDIEVPLNDYLGQALQLRYDGCLLYTSDAADERG